MTITFRDAHLKQGDFASTTWRIVDAPPETSVQDLLQPAAWAHISYKLRGNDELIVVPQGAPYRAHLIVMDAGKNFAKVRVLSVVLLNETSVVAVPQPDALPEALPADAPLEVKWNPGSRKYAIHRKGGDKERIHDGFAIKAESIAWALKHIGSMAA